MEIHACLTVKLYACAIREYLIFNLKCTETPQDKTWEYDILKLLFKIMISNQEEYMTGNVSFQVSFLKSKLYVDSNLQEN